MNFGKVWLMSVLKEFSKSLDWFRAAVERKGFRKVHPESRRERLTPGMEGQENWPYFRQNFVFGKYFTADLQRCFAGCVGVVEENIQDSRVDLYPRIWIKLRLKSVLMFTQILNMTSHAALLPNWQPVRSFIKNSD